VSFKITLKMIDTAIPYLKQINQSCGYVVRLSSRSSGASVSFTSEFPPNFDMKNMILTSTKDFSQKKKGPKFTKKIARFL
jgi:tRNA splicing ligase